VPFLAQPFLSLGSVLVRDRAIENALSGCFEILFVYDITYCFTKFLAT